MWYLIIWSAAENYFQKILSLPPPPSWKNPLFPFLLTSLLKIQKMQGAPHFANIEIFSAHPCRKEGGGRGGEEDTMKYHPFVKWRSIQKVFYFSRFII